MKSFYSLLGQSSFYGSNEETVCSLLLCILSRPGHKDKSITQSLKSLDHIMDDISFISSEVTKDLSNRVLLLQIVAKCLHKLGGFFCMEVSDNYVLL